MRRGRALRSAVRRQQQAQKNPQPGEEEADVVAGADEDGVDRVTAGAGEAVAFEQAVGFGVADDRLDGGSVGAARV